MSGRDAQGSRHGHGHGARDAHGAAGTSVHRHHREAPRSLRAAVLTVSDTRTAATDTGGALLAELLEQAGHRVVCREIVPDDVDAIRAAARHALGEAANPGAGDAPDAEVLLVTGGTGVAPRDVTPEALRPLLDRELPGFGELFRMLSFEEIGAAALVSRAFAGLRGGRPVFALPGSRGAIRLAMTRLVLPELGHLAHEGRKRAQRARSEAEPSGVGQGKRAQRARSEAEPSGVGQGKRAQRARSEAEPGGEGGPAR